MAAIVGTAGLKPVMRALRGRRHGALANKEALVSAGALMIQARGGERRDPAAGRFRAQCDLPVLRPRPAGEVGRIILTASGGPFRDWPLERMRAATPEQAVAAPQLVDGRQDLHRFAPP